VFHPPVRARNVEARAVKKQLRSVRSARPERVDGMPGNRCAMWSALLKIGLASVNLDS
jgi:hypothetical protein